MVLFSLLTIIIYAKVRKERMSLSLIDELFLFLFTLLKENCVQDVLVSASVEGCPGELIADMEVPLQTLLLYLASSENELVQF